LALSNSRIAFWYSTCQTEVEGPPLGK
jgi:hypothetical protein